MAWLRSVTPLDQMVAVHPGEVLDDLPGILEESQGNPHMANPLKSVMLTTGRRSGRGGGSEPFDVDGGQLVGVCFAAGGSHGGNERVSVIRLGLQDRVQTDAKYRSGTPLRGDAGGGERRGHPRPG